jgi:hypothetical protein
MSKRSKVMLRVIKGGLAPADDYSASMLRDRKYKIGDIVAGDITKPRNPHFHRLAHVIGKLCADNIEEFTGMEVHAVLKRIQLEARIECDEVAYKIPGYGMVQQFIPRSLSFESMGEEQFHSVVRSMCRWIADQYWPSVTPEAIEEMAMVMVGE